jgi:DNA-directed RNA polymerase specialized sigma24 family protein
MQNYDAKLSVVASAISMDDEDVKEVMLDVYGTALDNFEHFEGSSSLFSWLYQTTVETALRKSRSRRTRSLTCSEEEVNSPVSEDKEI